MTRQLSADVATVRANLGRIRHEIAEACARAGRDPQGVRICVATKYVDADGLEVLREAGVEIAAENRLQDLSAKQERFGEDAFEWHFIGAIQSKKIPEIARRVSLIHSLASESARARLNAVETPPRVLVQVNISGEESKQGVRPEDLPQFLAGCDFPVAGVMTMPPLTDDPEDARVHFAALREIASQHALAELSMGTSQDYAVAVEEGATLIRVGSTLFDPVNT